MIQPINTTQELGLRINEENPNHHLPSSPKRATPGRDGDESLQLGIRVNADNPNHHLWNNNGTWYIHYTVYPTPVTAERVRRSLKTKDLEIARRKRDRLFAQFTVARGGAA